MFEIKIKSFFFYSKQALAGKLDAEREGIVVPLTLEDYCIKPKIKPSSQEMAVSWENGIISDSHW